MIFTAVVKTGEAPNIEQAGIPFWSASTEDSGVEDDPLEASVLSPQFELVSWYRLTDFSKVLQNWKPDSSSNIPIEIYLPITAEKSSERERNIIWVSQDEAARRFLTACVQLVEAISSNPVEVWVRVE